MTDREQTRRDAVLKCTDLLNSLAAELSKAERDREEAQGFLSDQIERIRAAEARLAKVPALVEHGNAIVAAQFGTDGKPVFKQTPETVKALYGLRDALAVWEQE